MGIWVAFWAHTFALGLVLAFRLSFWVLLCFLDLGVCLTGFDIPCSKGSGTDVTYEMGDGVHQLDGMDGMCRRSSQEL